MYEIEIKSLLGGPESAERLEARMRELDPQLETLGAHRQLNHYFEGKGDLAALAPLIKDAETRAAFLDLAGKAGNASLRTRDADGRVLLVLKAAIDDTTSANGTARRELEAESEMPIEKLDGEIEKAGFSCQAKWSRERKEFRFKGTNVTIDRNAGYGYLAEFEKIESDGSRAEAAKAELRALMAELGIEELPQNRLARMFDFYNAHWRDYYGTEKTFTVQ